MALKYIGSLEVIMCLASQPDIHPIKWSKEKTPVFIAKDTFDFQVPLESRKTINVQFSKQHALLTGPNKGGKSTVLRALSISVLLAHTYGCAPGYLTLTPFKKMHVCLKPDDLPGSKSRFEREIEFTANTLESTEPSLVFIDELYHSTNPPDALRSCQIYCDKLWNKRNIISVISTHLFEFVEKAPDTIQRLCCPAKLMDNTIEFSYIVNTGVCKVSSVDELLKRNGLLK
jgi:DNA mismatch repair ATPase MutS